jgi:hypothetical protein
MKVTPDTPGYISPEAQATHIEKMAEITEKRSDPRRHLFRAKTRRVQTARTESPTGSINPAFRRL